MICCETCPRVFHLSCVEEPLDLIIPDAAWYCKRCNAKNGSLVIRNKGVFKALLDNIDSTNPREFRLPLYIREAYDHIFTHPITGACVDMRDVIVARATPKGRPKKGIKRGFSSLQTPETQLRESGRMENSGMCHNCSKSGAHIFEPSFLSSHSFVDVGRRACRSELLKCDYCSLHWHMDCLDAPLAIRPSAFSESCKEWIDNGEISVLKSQLWGGKSPLDEQTFYNPLIPFQEQILSCQDMYALGRAAVGSPILATYQCITIRPKWMCPCHAEWILPKLKLRTQYPIFELPDRPISWMGTHKQVANQISIPKKQRRPLRFRVVYNASASCSPTSDDEKNSVDNSKYADQLLQIDKNNGHIEIENTQSTIDFYSQCKYVIPERVVQYSFLKKLRPTKLSDMLMTMDENLSGKFEEFNAIYESKIEGTVCCSATESKMHQKAVSDELRNHSLGESTEVLLYLI